MSYWHRLVADNPLLRLVLGASVRSLSPKGLKAATTTVWLIVAVIVGLSLLSGYYSEFLAWQFFLVPLLVLLLLIPLAVLHGSIAGEREKRSIEILLAAPLSSSQILVAKFSKVLLPLGICIATFVPVAVAIEVGHLFKRPVWLDDFLRPAWISFTVAMSVIVASALFASALTVFVSARTRTTSAALIGSLFAMLAWLVGLPILVASLSTFGGTSREAEVALRSNPFYVLFRLLWDRSVATPNAVRDGVVLAVVLAALAVLLVAGSRKRVREFRGKSQDA